MQQGNVKDKRLEQDLKMYEMMGEVFAQRYGMVPVLLEKEPLDKWGGIYWMDFSEAGFGRCLKTGEWFWEYRGDELFCHPKPKDTKTMVVADSEFHEGALYVKPEFGCIEHKLRKD